MGKKKKGGKKKKKKDQGASKVEAEALPPIELPGLDYKYRVGAQDALVAVVDFLVTDGLEEDVAAELRAEIFADALLAPFGGAYQNEFAETLHFCIKLSLSSPFLDQTGFGAVVVVAWGVLHELANHWYGVLTAELGVEEQELQNHLWKLKGKSISHDDSRLLGACETLGRMAESLRNDSKKNATRWFVIQRMRVIQKASMRSGATPPWKAPWNGKEEIEKVSAEIVARVTAAGPPVALLVVKGKVVAVDCMLGDEEEDVSGARQAMRLPVTVSCAMVTTAIAGAEELTAGGKCRVFMAGGPEGEGEEEAAEAKAAEAPVLPRNVVGTMVLKKVFLKHEREQHKDSRTLAGYACLRGPLLIVLPSAEDEPEAREAVLNEVARVSAGILTCWGQASMKAIFPDFVAAGAAGAEAGAAKSSAKE